MSLIREIQFDASNLSAFGTLETGELTPVIQGDWVYGINAQLWTTGSFGVGANVDALTSRVRLQSGTSGSGYAFLRSRKPVRYRAGQGTTVRFTPLYTTGSANNVQLWGMGTLSGSSGSTVYDGYFYGYSGSTFGINHYNRGVNTFIEQTNWNGDTVDGSAGTSFTWNKSLGIPVQIKYPFLGYGDILFQIENPDTARFITTHVIKYANTSASTQLENPTMYFMGYTANNTNTSSKTMYCASVGAFISGGRSFAGNPDWAADASKTNIGVTETNLLSVKNAYTYNTLANRGVLRLNQISVNSSSSSLGIATFRLRVNAVVGGTPTWTAVSGSVALGGSTITVGNSIASYDTAGTTSTGGSYIFNISLNNNNAMTIDLTPQELYVLPGDILTIGGVTTASAILGISLNWSEDI